MKKQLNSTNIANELKNGSRFFSQQTDSEVESEQPVTKKPETTTNEIPVEPELTKHSLEHHAAQSTSASTTQSTDLSVDRSTSKSTELPDKQSTNQSTKESTTVSTSESTTNRYDESPILGRPKSFYISHQQDKDLDLAVAKLASGEFGPQIQKIDRSSIIRLILEEMDVTSEETLQRLHQRYVDRQIYQLNSRRSNRQQS